MLHLPKAPTNGIQTVAFRYLEPDHTATAAHAVYQTIVMRIKSSDGIENFDDLITITHATAAC